MKNCSWRWCLPFDDCLQGISPISPWPEHRKTKMDSKHKCIKKKKGGPKPGCDMRTWVWLNESKHSFEPHREQQEEAEEMAARSMNVLITGANRGLGLEMVVQMVKGSIPVKKLIACCRDPDGPRAEVSPELLMLLFTFHAVCTSALCVAGIWEQFIKLLITRQKHQNHDLSFKHFLIKYVSRPCKHWWSSIRISSRSSVWVVVNSCPCNNTLEWPTWLRVLHNNY